MQIFWKNSKNIHKILWWNGKNDLNLQSKSLQCDRNWTFNLKNQ